jgi:hypothetical protein
VEVRDSATRQNADATENGHDEARFKRVWIQNRSLYASVTIYNAWLTMDGLLVELYLWRADLPLSHTLFFLFY